MSAIQIDRNETNNINEQLAKVGNDGFVSAQDVIFLRKAIYANGVLTKEELNTLLELGERAPDGDPEWVDFFGEASADYYLREEIPHDYITEREFIDLKAQVTRYAPTVTPLVLSMLIKLISTATATPPDFGKFVSEQIKNNILIGDSNPIITKNDVTQIRNFLYAMGSEGGIAVTQDEVSLLFDLNDATICTQNDPAWSELFVKAVVNHLMAHLGYVGPSREEALHQWQWMNDNSTDITSFFKRMVAGGLSSLRQVYNHSKLDKDTMPLTDQSGTNVYEQVLKSRELAASDAAKLTTDEIEWLANRIGRDGIMDGNERALIEYMRGLGDELPEALSQWT